MQINSVTPMKQNQSLTGNKKQAVGFGSKLEVFYQGHPLSKFSGNQDAVPRGLREFSRKLGKRLARVGTDQDIVCLVVDKFTKGPLKDTGLMQGLVSRRGSSLPIRERGLKDLWVPTPTTVDDIEWMADKKL